MELANLIKVILGYGVIALPQIYALLQQYQAQHPSPYIAIVLSLLGGMLLNHAEVPSGKK